MIFSFLQYEGANLPSSITETTDKKKVLYYIADSAGSVDPRPFSHHFEMVFKTHLPVEYTSDNVFPVPLGYVNGVPHLSVKPLEERNYNVFFSGDLNRNRIDLYRNFSFLKNLLPKRGLPSKVFRKLLINHKNDFSDFFPDSLIVFNNGFKNGFSPKTYGEILADSKIILSPMGFGNPECFRNFEAMRAGCVIISDKLPPTEFYQGSPIIQIENWKEGLAWAQKLMKDQEMLQDYHLKTVDWWNQKCSERAVADYMKNKLLKKEPVPVSTIKTLG